MKCGGGGGGMEFDLRTMMMIVDCGGCCRNSLWVNYFASKIGRFIRDGPKDGTAKKMKIQTCGTPMVETNRHSDERPKRHGDRGYASLMCPLEASKVRLS